MSQTQKINNSLQQQLERFGEGYPNVRLNSESFGKGNSEYQLMCDTIPALFATHMKLPNLRIKGSVGNGNWALIPWIVFFDDRISISATRGFDVVFLFSLDCQTLFLSLNQGWTYYHEKYKTSGREKIQRVSKYLQRELSSIPANTQSTIKLYDKNLKLRTSLPEGYELGNIAAFKYDLHDLPDDQTILSNVTQLYDCLNELRSTFKTTSFEQIINQILNSPMPQAKVISKEKETSSVLLKQNFNQLSIEEITTPIHHDTNFVSEAPAAYKGFKQVKQDYVLREENNSKIGFLGEKLILAFEKQRVGLKNQAKVIHVSDKLGDGYGYDIQSIDHDGKPIFIEVKTTLGGKKTPFHFSANEYTVAKAHPTHYFIYRVFKPQESSNAFQFYKIAATDLLANYALVPESFLVRI